MTPPPPCRLYCILARRGDRAVIFRRGPSKQVQLVLWHTASDKFVPGQWLKGRVYERRCDLSPDGRHLIYFAAKHKEPFPSWTAISRPPYFTALVLWPKEDCWDGGGLFESRTRVWLNHPASETEIHSGEIPKNWTVRHNEACCLGEDGPVESARLERDGWVTTQKMTVEKVIGPPRPTIRELLRDFELPIDADDELREKHERIRKFLEEHKDDDLTTESIAGYKTEHPRIRTRSRIDGTILENRESIHGFLRVDEYCVIAADGRRNELTGVEWADFDQQGRIVFARAGGLWEATIAADGSLAERLLHDFNDHVFEAVVAPEEMRHW